MKKYTQQELKEILNLHQHWLWEDCEGWENMRANLSNADLSNADLRDADLRHANMVNADLSNANFRDAIIE